MTDKEITNMLHDINQTLVAFHDLFRTFGVSVASNQIEINKSLREINQTLKELVKQQSIKEVKKWNKVKRNVQIAKPQS